MNKNDFLKKKIVNKKDYESTIRVYIIRSHYLEPPSPILTLGVNPFLYIFIFRTDLLRFLREFSRLCTSYCIPIHCCDAIVVISKITMARSVVENLRSMHCTVRNNVFARNMFLKIKRYGKGLTRGYSADGGSG